MKNLSMPSYINLIHVKAIIVQTMQPKLKTIYLCCKTNHKNGDYQTAIVNHIIIHH